MHDNVGTSYIIDGKFVLFKEFTLKNKIILNFLEEKKNENTLSETFFKRKFTVSIYLRKWSLF